MASAITHFTELSGDFNYTTNMEALVRTALSSSHLQVLLKDYKG